MPWKPEGLRSGNEYHAHDIASLTRESLLQRQFPGCTSRYRRKEHLRRHHANHEGHNAVRCLHCIWRTARKEVIVCSSSWGAALLIHIVIFCVDTFEYITRSSSSPPRGLWRHAVLVASGKSAVKGVRLVRRVRDVGLPVLFLANRR